MGNAFCTANAAAWWRTCSVFHIQQKKHLPFQWKSQPKLGGARTAGSAREVHVLPDLDSHPSCHGFRSGSRFPLRLSGWRQALAAPLGHRAHPFFFGESKWKRSLFPEYVVFAAALLVGARALLSSAVWCSCSLTAQKPAPLRGKVCCGWLGELCFLDCLKNSFRL